MGKSITYSSTGVNYTILDPIKKLAQQSGLQTSQNLTNFGFKEVFSSRGESAYVWEEPDCYRAFVVEGLGTKNLVADQLDDKSYYRNIAQDTVAAIVNDIITVGAQPLVVNAYFATGSPDWFTDTERAKNLVEGFADACNMAGCTWGGGETPGLAGIINPETIDLAGACVGIIKPKSRLVTGDKLQANDAILLIESSGIHANGLSLARSILPGNTNFAKKLLIPAFIYVKLIKDLFNEGVDIHYMVNITGHGFRKLMRANKEFTYVINKVPPEQELFTFIQQKSRSSDEEMYGNFNMGAGFAIYLPADQVPIAQEIATKNNLKSWNAGVVEDGEKQVIIKSKNITFKKETLGVR